ncbi:MAG: zf-TFIIB domain-containing protein [Candidatus Omnitrophota bacterium]
MSKQITCNTCGKLVSSEMRNCPFCNEKLTKKPTAIIALCPRCNDSLDIKKYQGTELRICNSCDGMWIDNKTFKRLTSEKDVYNDPSIAEEYVKKMKIDDTSYLKCPVCEELMIRKQFNHISGVLIDVCGYHGFWLDKGELEQIRIFIANGGLEMAQDKSIRENRENIEFLAHSLKDVEFMQKILHIWDFKRWMFKGFK